jgi:1-aminocyclopropane-1-carboxylate deaminase
MSNAKLLQALDNRPVGGVPLANVSLLRLDLFDALAPGNKWFKLQGHLARARAQGIGRLVSFGGAWSNHLHALAALGKKEGVATVGIVRGDDGGELSATLRDCRQWGMELVFVSRSEYRRRHDPDYRAQLAARFDSSLLIPEGGGNSAGVSGCIRIGRILAECQDHPGRVVVAVGTGTTLAGIAIGLGAGWDIFGVSALKGATDLEDRIAGAIENSNETAAVADWELLHDDHCGGFARVTPVLKQFMLDFEAVHQVPLDHVYTGKALLAVHRLRRTGIWAADDPVTVIHTGGLQGRRGVDWLS